MNNSEARDEYSLYVAHSQGGITQHPRIRTKPTFAYGYELRSGEEYIDSDVTVGIDRQRKEADHQLHCIQEVLRDIEGPARVTIVTKDPAVLRAINISVAQDQEELPKAHQRIIDAALKK